MARASPAKRPSPPAVQRVESRESQLARIEGQRCDVCSAPMSERLCRYVCPRCGYQRDCEDP